MAHETQDFGEAKNATRGPTHDEPNLIKTPKHLEGNGCSYGRAAHTSCFRCAGNGPCGWVNSFCRCHDRGWCIIGTSDYSAYAFNLTTLTATTMATTGATG